MWHQFVDERWIRSRSSSLLTVIYLERGVHPGMPTPQRRELLETWNERLLAPGGGAAVRGSFSMGSVMNGLGVRPVRPPDDFPCWWKTQRAEWCVQFVAAGADGKRCRRPDIAPPGHRIWDAARLPTEAFQVRVTPRHTRGTATRFVYGSAPVGGVSTLCATS
ncbi:MAG: hypothetical protein ACJAR2_002495 [Ilumatobacter sp.]|jgi:hypothetical protein